MAAPFGRYELLKKIASGGMGQVFLARTATQGFEKLVVIKRILPHLVEDEEFITMFFDEAKIAARLNHPNLVQIFDMGEANGSNYLAMEYVAGEDLRRADRHARRQGNPIPLGLACRVVADAAAALDYAHKVKDPHGAPLNLIHRDVSPQNILVGFDGGVKLIDFGVAKAAGRMQHTATGMLKGKYPYMSPEQIAGEPYDHRSDQFALGVVFWEILTGRRLFKGDSDLVTMRLVRECVVPPPSQLNPALPRAIDEIVLKALSKNAADRYPDTAAFRMALEDFAIAQSLPASSAHLASFMRELYAERIEREADIHALDELTARSAFEESASESRSSNLSAARPMTAVAAPTVPDASTPPFDPPRRALRTRAILGAALAAIVLIAAVVAVLLPRPDREAQDPAPIPPMQPIEIAVPAAPVEAVPALEVHDEAQNETKVEETPRRKATRRAPIKKPDTSSLDIKTGR